MLQTLLKPFTGSHYKKFYKRCRPLIEKINRIEESYQTLSDEELLAKTTEFRRRYEERCSSLPENASPEKQKQVQDDFLEGILPEAFAAVKNAARRLCGTTCTVTGNPVEWQMVHFDEQLIGGMALHDSMIAEMATGEGKTLVATLPLYLNALVGRNCQLVTVNDYLARRDSEWMGYLYTKLGLTVGCIQNGMDPASRRDMYNRDITYGTASEFGFDYLRDNGMAGEKSHQVQKEHFYCIVDEIDSILVDEARTPLIISGPVQVQREMPFGDFKGSVQKLTQNQVALCNKLVSESKAFFDKERERGESPPKASKEEEQAHLDAKEEALGKLLQVKLGMPKNKQFLRLMEEGFIRKPFDKYDTDMMSKENAINRHKMKEELFFTIDEKSHVADLTEKGRLSIRPDDEDAFVLPDLATDFSEIDKDTSLSDEDKQKKKLEVQEGFEKTSETIHTISQLLRAYSIYERDVQYIVKEGKVQIIDENTGRVMPGRRWSDGLHQAVEAKENVTIEKETKTYATITIQNYFRMYEKLAGMTGTAETEANEFLDIYKLRVMVIPTHRPIVRSDENDVIYKTRREKYNAVIEEIKDAHKRGQPVLVGTVNVDHSEVLSRMLRRTNITHSVLNAKQHEKEAEIVARAGQKGAVTIATNMAGRGTDIKLGEGVVEAGGLYVIGTERHQSRRIDRQLRGRSGRQGDPGRSKFFISLEDDLMRLFASSGPIANILQKTFKEGEVLEHPILNRSIQNAQKKVEEHNYSIRKRLLQYDDVLNKQREVVYELRNDVIHAEAPKDILFELIEEEIDFRVGEAELEGTVETDEAAKDFALWVNTHFPVGLKVEDVAGKDNAEVREKVLRRIRDAYQNKEALEDPEQLKLLERFVIIRAIDKHWQSHLTEMEDLRQSVGLRSYGQKDPLNEYKSEAYKYFEELMENMRMEAASSVFRYRTQKGMPQNLVNRMVSGAQAQGPGTQGGQATRRAPAQRLSPAQITARRVAARAAMAGPRQNQPGATPGGQPQSGAAATATASAPARATAPTPAVNRKLGRNDPDPCGAGKKIKQCQF